MMSIVAIVIIAIIAIAGWSAYLAIPITKTVTSIGTSGTTATTSTSTSTSSSLLLTPVTSNDSFTVAGFTQTPDFAIWYLGIQSGIFAKYVPNAKFESLSGAQVPTALSANSAQVGYSDTTAFVPSIVQGMPIHYVANLIIHGTPVDLIVATNSTYQSIQDLHGQTFTCSTVGATSYYWLLNALSKLGWKLNTDFKITPLGTVAAQAAAVEKGTVAAMLFSSSGANALIATGKLRSIYNFTIPYPFLSVVARNDFISAHPQALHALVYAFTQTIDLWNTNSTAAERVLESQFNMSSTLASQVAKELVFSPDGGMSISGMQEAPNLLYSFGGINQTMAMENYISNEFVPVYY